MPPIIYHITSQSEWERARAAGAYTAPSLAQEGFIHASTREQVIRTANLYFQGAAGLVLLCIDAARLTAELRYDPVPGTGQQFPHIYGPLNLDAVIAVIAFPAHPLTGQFELPDSLPS